MGERLRHPLPSGDKSHQYHKRGKNSPHHHYISIRRQRKEISARFYLHMSQITTD
jgi:hypothetical protein